VTVVKAGCHRHEKAAVVSHFVEPDIDECPDFQFCCSSIPGYDEPSVIKLQQSFYHRKRFFFH
jgi:hypothetical protein